MDAANGAATATISNGGTPVAPTDRTAVDTLVGRNITDHTAPDATALRECHFGEQQYPRQRCEQAGEKSALVGHGAIIAARRGEKEGPDGRSENAGKPTTSTPEPHRWCREVANPSLTPTRSVGFSLESPMQHRLRTARIKQGPAGGRG